MLYICKRKICFSYSQHFWCQRCGFFLHQPILQLSGHQLGVLRFNNGSNLQELVETYRSRTRSHKTPPTSDANSKSQVLTGYKLLEWLTELRTMLYLQLLVYYKGYNTGTTKWERCMEQGCGKGHGVSMPSLRPLSRAKLLGFKDS